MNDLESIRYASFLPRLGAQIIDMLFMGPIIYLSYYNTLTLKSMGIMVLISVFMLLYKPIMEWAWSATLGKMILGLKVIDSTDHDVISLEQSLLRFIPWLISSLITLAINVELYTLPEFDSISSWDEISAMTQKSSYAMVNSIYSFIFVVLVGSLAFNPKYQGFHDILAKTYCVHKEANGESE